MCQAPVKSYEIRTFLANVMISCDFWRLAMVMKGFNVL